MNLDMLSGTRWRCTHVLEWTVGYPDPPHAFVTTKARSPSLSVIWYGPSEGR